MGYHFSIEEYSTSGLLCTCTRTHCTLKTPGLDLTRKSVRGGGDTHFGVRPTRNPGQTDPESKSERDFGLRFRVILTQIPDQSDPGMGPVGPFSGSNLTREFLECGMYMFVLTYTCLRISTFLMIEFNFFSQ